MAALDKMSQGLLAERFLPSILLRKGRSRRSGDIRLAGMRQA